MNTININNHLINVKDYYCIGEKTEEYIKKAKNKLWLYVNITSMCNLSCKFCINAMNNREEVISVDQFKRTLYVINDYVEGVSITGGEPMLFPNIVDSVLDVINDILPKDIRVNIVTNGTKLFDLLSLRNLNRIHNIHISKHSVEDDCFDMLLPDFIKSLDDPGKVCLNCVLQKEMIDSIDSIEKYLNMAIDNGVLNVSFINMFIVNNYSKEKFISIPVDAIKSNKKFIIWNEHFDYDICHCCNYSYINNNKIIRFYFRCPTGNTADYIRQLVFDSDNKLKAGFNGEVLL